MRDFLKTGLLVLFFKNISYGVNNIDLLQQGR